MLKSFRDLIKLNHHQHHHEVNSFKLNDTETVMLKSVSAVSAEIDLNGIYVDILWANEIKLNVRFMSHHTKIRNMSMQKQQQRKCLKKMSMIDFGSLTFKQKNVKRAVVAYELKPTVNLIEVPALNDTFFFCANHQNKYVYC